MLRDPALIPLSRDHHHALALCVQIRRALQPSSPEDPASLARYAVSFFDGQMKRHFRQEEDVVFPIAQQHSALRPVVSELLSEHIEIAAIVDQLRVHVSAQALSAFAEKVTDHVRKEERVLFEQAQQILSRDELDRIGAVLLS